MLITKKRKGNISARHRDARHGSRYPAVRSRLTMEMKGSRRWLLFGFFILCWLPYLVVFFPGLNTGDTARQICMFFRLPTRVAGRELTDGVKVIYSSHHPLFMTWIFGACYKLGYAGLALYSVLQMCLAAGVFTGAIVRLKRIGAPVWSLVLCSLWLGLNPNISVFVINMLSDAPFAFLSLLFTMLLTDVVYSKGEELHSTGFDLKLLAVMLLTAFCKKQGMYIVVFMTMVFLLAYLKEWKRWLLVLAAFILVFKGGYEGLLYKALNVQTSGAQEALSLPFQQTARYFRDYDGEIGEDEKAAVDSVLDGDMIAELYKEDTADPVKNTFHGTGGELGDYFKAWFKGLTKAPGIYISAAVRFTDGYFLPLASELPAGQHFQLTSVEELISRYPQITSKYKIGEEQYASFNFTSPETLKGAREFVKNAIFRLDELPVIGNILSIGLCFILTILLWFVLLFTGRWREALPWMVSLLGIAMCILSPLDGCARYALPVTIAFPVMFGVMFKKSI